MHRLAAALLSERTRGVPVYMQAYLLDTLLANLESCRAPHLDLFKDNLVGAFACMNTRVLFRVCKCVLSLSS